MFFEFIYLLLNLFVSLPLVLCLRLIVDAISIIVHIINSFFNLIKEFVHGLYYEFVDDSVAPNDLDNNFGMESREAVENMTTTGEIANLQATAFSRQSSAINSWSTSKISVSGVRRRNSNKIKETKNRKTKNKTELFPRDQKSREISICVPAHLAKNSLARPQILPLAGQEKNFRASSTSLSSIAKADQLRNIDIPPQREVKITSLSKLGDQDDENCGACFQCFEGDHQITSKQK